MEGSFKSALAKYLQCKPSQLKESSDYGYRGQCFEYNDEEYLIYDDYSDAESDAVDYVKQTIDELGLESFSESFQQEIVNDGLVDVDWFKLAMRESNENYVYDIESEESSDSKYANRLIEECADADIISDDEIDENGEYTGELDLAEEYAEYLNNREPDAVEWFRDNFGEREMADVVRENNLLDEDAVAERCVESDGVANSLASYDSEERTFDYKGTTYYIYRTN